MSDITKCPTVLTSPPTQNIVYGSSITQGGDAEYKEGGAFLITEKIEGHTPLQPYSCQIDHYRGSTSCLQDEHLDMTTAIERAAIKLHLARGRVNSLLHSVSVLDEWLEENEGKIADEVRLRRVKHWREEALEQLRRNP